MKRNILLIGLFILILLIAICTMYCIQMKDNSKSSKEESLYYNASYVEGFVIKVTSGINDVDIILIDRGKYEDGEDGTGYNPEHCYLCLDTNAIVYNVNKEEISPYDLENGQRIQAKYYGGMTESSPPSVYGVIEVLSIEE